MALNTQQRPDEDQKYNPGDAHSKDLFDQKKVDSEFGRMTGTPDMRALEDQANASARDSVSRNNNPSRNSLKSDRAENLYKPSSPSKKKSLVPGLSTKTKVTALLGGIGLFASIAAIIFGGIASFLIHVGANFTEWANKRTFAKTTLRYTKVAEQKYFSEPDDNCTGYKCRFTSGVDDAEIDRLQKSGLLASTGEPDVKTTPGGKKYIGKLTLSDGTIIDSAEKYKSAISTNQELRFKQASVSQSDAKSTRNSKFTKILRNKIKLKRSNPVAKETDPDKMKTEVRKTAAGVNATEGARLSGDTEGEENNARNAEVDDLSREIQQAGSEQRQSYIADPNFEPTTASLDISEAGRALGRGALKGLSVTGVVDVACHAWSLLKAVAFGAKYYRMIGLIRYAGVFLTFSDALKRGDVQPAQVNFIVSLLTKPDSQGRTFADSPGAQSVFYGTTPSKESVAPYAMGTVLAVGLSSAINEINSATGGNADSVCKVTRSTLYQAGSIVLSIGLAILTGGGSVLLSTAAGAASSVAVGVIEAYAIPALIQYASGIAMSFNEDSYVAGTALASGVGALGSIVGRSNGLRPMTKSEIAQDNREVASLVSDFGYDQRESFNDKINANVAMFNMRLMGSVQSFSLSPQKLLGLSSSRIATNVSAVDAVQPAECDDDEINALNLATDASCNVIWSDDDASITDDNNSVLKTVDYMVENNHIDSETGEPKSDEYKQYVDTCIDGIGPLMQTDTGDESNANEVATGDLCMRNDQKYKYFRYQRTDFTATETEEEAKKAMENNTDNPATAPVSSATPGAPGQTEPLGNGFTLKNNTDYTGTPCAAGSEEKETYTHPQNGYKIKLCQVGSMKIASVISDKVVAMVNAAAGAGVTLNGGAFRSYEQQIETRRRNNCPDVYNSPSTACSPPTAKPGGSQHERGLAIDFSSGGGSITSGSAQFRWLSTNASNYGFYNLPSESWHWSTSGN